MPQKGEDNHGISHDFVGYGDVSHGCRMDDQEVGGTEGMKAGSVL